MRETAVESHPFGFPLGFARGFGKTGQALFAKCAKKDGAPGIPLIAENAMSGAPAKSEGLETQHYLKFHHAACEALGGPTEVIAVGEISVALATGLKRRQVEHIKDVEKVCSEVEGSGLSQVQESGKHGVLSQCHVNLTVGRPAKPVAANAISSTLPGSDAVRRKVRAVTPRSDVEIVESTIRVSSILWKHPIDEALIGRSSPAFPIPLRREVVTDTVAIDIIGGSARSSKEAAALFWRPREARVNGQDTIDLPTAESFPHEASLAPEDWQVPQTVKDELMADIEVRRAIVKALLAGISLLCPTTKRGSIKALAPAVAAVQLEAAAARLVDMQNHGVEVRINVW
jgi:hypothetical protein